MAGLDEADRKGWGPDQVIETAIKVALLGVLAYASWAIVSPFLTIGIWSAVLVVALYPLYSKLAAGLGPRLAAVLLTIVSIAVVLGPLAWLGYGIVHGVEYLFGELEQGRPLVPMPPERVKTWPLAGEQIYQAWHLAATNVKALLADVAPRLRPLAPRILQIAQNVMLGLLEFLIAIIIAGFLFEPGPRIAESVSRILDRLLRRPGREIVRLIGATIRNVSRGVVGVAVLQTALIGLGFVVAGVPGAGALSFIALVLGILQIGPSLVVLPVVIWAWTEFGTFQALLFTVYMVAVGSIDNILRPIVMARGLTTPMPVIIVGVLGGTLSQGIMGLFLGPVVVAVSWQLVLAWLENEANYEVKSATGMDNIQRTAADSPSASTPTSN